MKVCFVTHDSPRDISGVSTWLRRLLPLLQMAGIEVEMHVMAIGGQPGVNCAFFKELGIAVRLMPFLTHSSYAVRSLLRLLEKGQPDIYVPNCIVPAYYAAGYARRAGIPTVGVLHADDLYYQGVVDEFINGDPDFRVSAVVAVSSFLESQVSSGAAARGVVARRIFYGVPIPAGAAEISGSVFRLVYTGNLIEVQKRISDVANALCTVTASSPNLEVWIVGDGDARPAVENIIREKGVGARVQLLGWVDNGHIYDVLAQCHSSVLLSDYEGLSVSMMEGMAAGLVPICLDMRSGIPDAIENGVNGLIVKDRAADFFGAVKGLQSDPAKWRQLSQAARETARRRFSVEECAREWVDLLEHLYRRGTAQGDFRAPRVLRLPPPDPKFDIFGIRLPWQQKFEQYVRSVPPIYRMVKATAGVGRKVKSGVERTGLFEKKLRIDKNF
jgi:glycosyltransferase involved in cell wall biosynthesis